MKHWIGLLLAASLVCGCAQPPVPEDSFYRLSTLAGSPRPVPPSRLDGTLVVRRLQADGLLSERSLVYAGGSTAAALQQYHYHFWTDSPTRLLQEVLVPYLRGAHVATEVITPEIGTDAKFELSGKVQRFEQIRGASPRVVVEMEFALSEPLAAKLLWVHGFRAEVECADESISTAVGAFNSAVTQIFDRLVKDF